MAKDSSKLMMVLLSGGVVCVSLIVAVVVLFLFRDQLGSLFKSPPPPEDVAGGVLRGDPCPKRMFCPEQKEEIPNAPKVMVNGRLQAQYDGGVMKEGTGPAAGKCCKWNTSDTSNPSNCTQPKIHLKGVRLCDNYESLAWQSFCRQFPPGDYPDLQGDRRNPKIMGNPPNIMSLKIAPGYKVELFPQPNFGGASRTFDADVPSLNDLGGHMVNEAKLDKNVRSMKVTKLCK